MWLFSVQHTFILGTSYLSKPCWQFSVALQEHTHTAATGNLMPSYEITQLFNRLFWNVSCRAIWELLGLAWTISTQHTKKKLERHPKKVFSGKIFIVMTVFLSFCTCGRLHLLFVTWGDEVWREKVFYCVSHSPENARETLRRSLLSNKYLLSLINESFCRTLTGWFGPKC